jgi:hypothetical protein
MNHLSLCFVILLLFLLIFISRKEGLVTNINEEIVVPVNKNVLITKIQLNIRLQEGSRPYGDAWINLGDITLRDRAGNQINYGNTKQNPNNVYFGGGGNWPGLPVEQLYDNDKVSMGHANRELENLIINLNPPVAIGYVQITNRTDCCWNRIGNYELALYNNNDRIGYVMLDRLVGQGKTVLYKMTYPK